MTTVCLGTIPHASRADADICDWPRGETIAEANLAAVNPTLRVYIDAFGVDAGQAQCRQDQAIRSIEDRYGLRGCCTNCATVSQHHNACTAILEMDESSRLNEVHQEFMRLMREYIQSPRPEREYVVGSFGLFEAAQTDWKLHQATLCKAEVSQNDGGTMQPTFMSECMVRLSQDRRAYIADLYQDYFDVPSAKD
jgi:uncharacterized protein YecT (DUF1311 family)